MPPSAVNPPVLSLRERDRRWAALRKLLRERGLDGAVIAGFRAREMYESYVSDDYNEGCVIFPLEGEPVIATWAHLRVLRALWSAERGHQLWIEDQRVATSGRRWESRGVLRTVLLMWRLRLLYALGASPDRLARLYHR